ncbi:hypothetical protein C479_07211 [Halovivax asiaticus JCM 14624]|uniref:Uncharacterized protein n=1 Tax=Halovivax asiaticus JCM 14624 TaxID=1227490 RepID=M0BMW6_9EURY|nr:hypothetical protein [Halovivax asiaticus]ELZ11633.1 hypothetical protein C479_07211 [Halovivax asiaticus JCM 14624]
MNQHDDERGRLLRQAALLEAVRGRTADRATLQAELDVSRATAYRWTTALAERNLLERSHDGYRTTGAGAAVADAVDRFERSVAAAERLEPLLETVSAPELTRHVDLFADAELAVATPSNPNRPIERWLEHFSSTERFRGFVVTGCPPAVTRQGTQNVEAGIDMEVICTPLALRADRNANEEAFESIAGGDAATLYTHPGLPFTMSLFDGTVILSGFDEETTLPVVTAATDDRAALAWAEGLYHRYRQEATAVTAATVDALA